MNAFSSSELKKKLRQLKKLEARLRFGAETLPAGKDSVWDTFFDLHERGRGKARYPMELLLAMDREQYRSALNEYFFSVYYRICQDNGILHEGLLDPEQLARLGLPPDADAGQVKGKFRKLALKLHPDMGGDAEEFIKLMENYRRLVEKGK